MNVSRRTVLLGPTALAAVPLLGLGGCITRPEPVADDAPLPQGSGKLWVLPLPAGDYSWSRFTMGTRFAVTCRATRFRVASGQLSYVGSVDLQVDGNTFAIGIRDRESAVRGLLSEQYPRLTAKYPWVKLLATQL